MIAGRLRHQVVLQYPTRTKDSAGSITNTWSDSDPVWAEVLPISKWDSERLQAMGVQAVVSHRVTIRYYSTLLPTWRIKFGTRYFTIVSIINPMERNISNEIYCKEVVM